MTDVATAVDAGEDEHPVQATRAAQHAYRSYFTFAWRPDSVELVLDQVGSWLRERKDIDVDLIKNQVGEFGNRTLTVVHNENSDGHQVRFLLAEQRPHECWQTVLTFFVPARAGRGWLDLTVSCDVGRPAEPPNVFGRIVDVLEDPRDGALPFRNEPPVVAAAMADDVIEWITDTDRHALLFVAASGTEIDFGKWVERIRLWARGMKGMAQMIILDPSATEELSKRLGPSHAISPWTIRTFRPGALVGQRSDGVRHRILSTGRLGTDSDSVIRRILAGAARRHANERATPTVLARTTRDLDRVATALMLERIFDDETSAPSPAQSDGASAVQPAVPTVPAVAPHAEASSITEIDHSGRATIEQSQLIEMRELISEQGQQLAAATAVLGPSWTRESLQKLVNASKEHQAVRAAYDRNQVVLKRSREELERSLTQSDDLRAELEALRGRLQAEEEERTFAELLRVQAEDTTRWLRGELKNLQRFDLATAPIPRDRETDLPLSFDDLVERLPDLVAHGVVFTGDETVARNLSDLDGNGKFALAAWESLLTLASCLEARRNGDFDGSVTQYLEDTPTGYRTLPPGKHAAGESGPTMDRYGNLRVFPVPVEVDPSCQAAMAAHFRLGKAGMRSPRLHYLDSYSTTGVMYVGYLGPHLRTVSTN